jgi:hypothetical protein
VHVVSTGSSTVLQYTVLYLYDRGCTGNETKDSTPPHQSYLIGSIRSYIRVFFQNHAFTAYRVTSTLQSSPFHVWCLHRRRERLVVVVGEIRKHHGQGKWMICRETGWLKTTHCSIEAVWGKTTCAMLRK